MKSKNFLLVALLASTVALAACDTKEGKYTTAQMTDAVIKQLQAERPDQPVTDEMRKQIEDSLTQASAVVEAARAEKLDQTEEVKALVQASALQTVAGEYFASKMAAYKPTDEELKKIYDDETQKMKDRISLSANEYHLRHILLDTQAQADEVIAKLKAGEKFEVLAKTSKDASSAVNGGDLGWNSLESWVPEFSEAAAKLKPKEYTQTAVQSQFGFHVIELLEAPRASKTPKAATPEMPSFDKVKPQVLEMAKGLYFKKLQDGFKVKDPKVESVEVKK